MQRKHREEYPITALYAASDGEIYDAPGIEALARIDEHFVELSPEDLIPLPETADLMFLPDRKAVGKNSSGEIIELDGVAVSAILPAGYTRLFLPAFIKEDKASMLPLYGYTSVVLYKDKLYAAAVYTDENHKWDPAGYNSRSLRKMVKQIKKALPNNRLVDHLANCSLDWHCLTAQNIFYHRWEAGIPTSPVCNANCLGCISLQPAECCPSPQERIAFRPTVDEVASLGIFHLQSAPEAIISFGQGCEGEPSLAADTISEAISRIRKETTNGQINMNSNAGYTDGIKKIVDAGLDSMRVSIISARDESYSAYYRCSYDLDSVKASIQYALEHGVSISLNLLYFPGFNDRDEEAEAWVDFIKKYPIQMIQVRNLNIDPDVFASVMPKAQGDILGTKAFINMLENARPDLVIGNFSHYQGKHKNL